MFSGLARWWEVTGACARVMDTEMPPLRAAPAMTTVIIESKVLSRMMLSLALHPPSNSSASFRDLLDKLDDRASQLPIFDTHERLDKITPARLRAEGDAVSLVARKRPRLRPCWRGRVTGVARHAR